MRLRHHVGLFLAVVLIAVLFIGFNCAALASFGCLFGLLHTRDILRAARRKNRSVSSPSIQANGLPRANLLALREAPGRRALIELNPLLFIRGGGTVIQNRKFNIQN